MATNLVSEIAEVVSPTSYPALLQRLVSIEQPARRRSLRLSQRSSLLSFRMFPSRKALPN